MNHKPLVLIILDGFGLAPKSASNAVELAKKPVFDKLWANFPHSQLQASGLAVGLPDGQMGNSEVGHLNIGAGRVVKQTLVQINDAIASNELKSNLALTQALGEAKTANKLHLVGLVSDGGVHSHINHLVALISEAKASGIENVFVHAITDGRDTAPNSGIDFIQELDLIMLDLGLGSIATISGRYFAMDRDNRWDRTARAYQALTSSDKSQFTSAEELLEDAYERGVTDEFIEPATLDETGLIDDGDVVIFFNFRPDRMVQLVSSFDKPTEIAFDSENIVEDAKLYSLTRYYEGFDGQIFFPPQILKRTLGEILASQDLVQHRIAETEKYAHVTYFFNGGYDQVFKNETRTLLPSPKVATYDMQPEMSAHEIADTAIADLVAGTSQVLIINFANCDMVGHTGDLAATIKAVEAVDYELGRVIEAIDTASGVAVITADHGNAEMVRDQFNQPVTSHTCNPVPLIITDAEMKLRDTGKLSDIAPTILELMVISQPVEMTGESLLL